MKTLILSATLLIGLLTNAQTRAVTDQGKEVILYDNGKWAYASDSSALLNSDSVRTNTQRFSKPADATFTVKSKRLNIGVSINPSKWTFKTGDPATPASEYMFTMKSTEGFAMLITEKTPIDLESLRAAAYLNAKQASPDAKEEFAEYRTVNGLKVLYLELKGTVQGIKFYYCGYYYSNPNGSVQLVSFTTQSSINTIKAKLLDILNGLTEFKQP